jgi:thioesterase domain-containing protein
MRRAFLKKQYESAQPHRPYLLLGHSFGATVAFELATRFEASGER